MSEMDISYWRRRKRRILAILTGVIVYLALWLLTWLLGVQAVRDKVLRDMPLPGPPTAFLDYSEMRESPAPGTRFYYCRGLAWAPFIVRVRFGWHAGPLSGDGGSALYAWLPSVAIRIVELDHWAE